MFLVLSLAVSLDENFVIYEIQNGAPLDDVVYRETDVEQTVPAKHRLLFDAVRFFACE
jgi:hypothetical protein